MGQIYELGQIAGLRITARSSAFMSMIAVWVVLVFIAFVLYKVPLADAVIGGLVAMLIHWVSALAHQLGHSFAARRTGYPMIGVYFLGALAMSIYPKNEPSLAGGIHIRRALGGPILSGLVALAAGWLYLFLTGTFTIGSEEPHYRYIIVLVGLFFFLDNLLVFTLGALLPLRFTDGGTILAMRGK